VTAFDVVADKPEAMPGGFRHQGLQIFVHI
jgi:hypothetical protein